MSNPLYAFPAVCEQTLRALARYPERTAFSWPGGSITYQGATDLIGRIQSVFMQLGFEPGTRGRFPDREPRRHLVRRRRRAIVAASDHLAASAGLARRPAVPARGFRSRRCWWSTARVFAIAAANSRAKAAGLKTVFTLGPADYGVDLLAAIEAAGSATPRCFAGPDDIATLNYTGGTTGKSKGALRYHREYARLRQRDPGRFRNSGPAALPHRGADQPRRRHQGAADPDARRHRAHA